ncbi:hypothetical protein [Amphritea pacifica]|uniref:Lipoprotein n=1 Tax=Amphritea pacifica TaxID=2811233 RepID=A0ABS2W9N0_9GAMM|nr:hypothetical protein [Amphritea pacifica]MBN0988426.1 hypothetical protein [Amphritea pacifica]MBN1007896.1 hypothetical protein [Amphritea pacifica]
MRRFVTIVLTFIIYLIVAGCEKNEPRQPFGERVKLSNPDNQIKFEQEISSIEYYKDREGYVIYSLHDYDLVLSAIRKAIYGDRFTPTTEESIILHNECRKEIYINLLKSVNINYSIEKGPDGAKDYLVWRQLDGYKVDKVRKEAEFEFLKRGPDCYIR